MPSPFPGMDPWLEHPALWPGVHQSLITYTRDELQRELGPAYIAQIGERVYIESEDAPRIAYPDIAVVRDLPRQARAAGIAPAAGAPDPAVLIEEPAAEVREVFVEILDAASGHSVVTVIEVLSPANKRPGLGRDLYLRKQADILESGTHLVEVDLLRGGEHACAAPRDRIRDPYHYLVSIARAPRRPPWHVHPIRIEQRLPRVGIPLRAPDPDVVVDLQALLDRAYDNGACARRIDYAGPATPPLSHEAAAWAREVLAHAGERM